MTVKRPLLARQQKSQGLSQEALAELLSVDVTTIRRWERGETEPQPWLRLKLALRLNLSAEQLDRLLHGTSGEPGPAERVEHALANPSSTDLATVAELREQVHELDERYDRAPSTSLLAAAGRHLAQASFLRVHAPSSRVRRELYAVEAEGATLLGQLVWDASQRRDHATAHGYFDQAIDAARELKDPSAESRALLRKAYVALYGERDPVKGLDLTMQAAETAKKISNVLAGLAVLHAAEAHAIQGQLTDCERALAEADQDFERITDADSAIDHFSPTQPGRLAGSCYLFLGRPRQAVPILATTARDMRDGSKSQAIVLGNLALGHLRQGEVDAAVSALHDAVGVIEQSWGAGGLNIVFSACRELQPWRDVVAVQDVYDRVMCLMAV